MLVDTSVWIDHLRNGNPSLAAALEVADVWCHPFVHGELACGVVLKPDDLIVISVGKARGAGIFKGVVVVKIHID